MLDNPHIRPTYSSPHIPRVTIILSWKSNFALPYPNSFGQVIVVMLYNVYVRQDQRYLTEKDLQRSRDKYGLLVQVLLHVKSRQVAGIVPDEDLSSTHGHSENVPGPAFYHDLSVVHSVSHAVLKVAVNLTLPLR